MSLSILSVSKSSFELVLMNVQALADNKFYLVGKRLLPTSLCLAESTLSQTGKYWDAMF